MQPTIYNIVLWYKLLGEIDVSNLEQSDKFDGFIIQDKVKKIKVYPNGKCIVTGVSNVADGDRLVRKHFPNNPIITRNVKEMTAIGKLPYGLSPFKLYQWQNSNTDTSPFRFDKQPNPRIYWTVGPEKVYFYSAGTVVIKGLKSLTRLDPIWDHFLSDIDKVLKA